MEIKETMGMKGKYLFTIADVSSQIAREIVSEIEEMRSKGHNYIPLLRELNTRFLKRFLMCENLLPTVGRAMVANNLTDATPTNAMRINYFAVGSNATAPANADTQLGTESYRNTVASETNSSNIAYVTGFLSASEASGTYAEAGIFADGTASANSGVLFSHVAISITKSLTETLTVDWTITLS